MAPHSPHPHSVQVWFEKQVNVRKKKKTTQAFTECGWPDGLRKQPWDSHDLSSFHTSCPVDWPRFIAHSLTTQISQCSPRFPSPCLSLISHCQLGPGPQWSSCHLLTTLMVMMWNSDLDLTGSYAAAAGIQHCSMCHVPINHGFRPGSAAYYDLKQIRYWIRANIIPSFKPSQTLAPTSLIHKEILCTPSSLPLQHSLFLLGCSASYPSISLHPLYEISEHAYWSI